MMPHKLATKIEKQTIIAIQDLLSLRENLYCQWREHNVNTLLSAKVSLYCCLILCNYDMIIGFDFGFK